ncbi:SDR family oxidoreductase [Mycobacterium sp.]|uniref:SDR family oxidoreductase n=1 Tax=Mycobacterium sp. TaxID=1785 RepID=UPI002D692F0E|nr:SDR family oxidoreductase [Mycobacterium sp.]HZA09517.1 SDR family oxidoreductase [Mycobacterium sp.]
MAESVFVSGAGRGIGRAIVRRFAGAGCTVGAVDIDDASLAALKSEAAENDWTVWTAAMDVTDFAAWQAALAGFVEPAGGRLDVLVNNAGVLTSGGFAEIPAARHRQIVDVNVTGMLFGCLAAFDYLRDTAGARVLNLCSASAIYGQPGLASYSATKFAVRGLTEALELEWRPHDITVRALWPLYVNTDMVAGMDIKSVQTLGVHLTADDIAEAAWQVAHRRSRSRKVHFPVGRQTKAAYYSAQLSPPWLTRLVNKRTSA